MKDKNGKNLRRGMLLSLNKSGSLRYFYVEQIGNNEIWGKRVNKDFSFNKYDKASWFNRSLLIDHNSIEVIDPIPDSFLESLRTLHFWVSEVLEEFGVIRIEKSHFLLRAVKFENGSYGIIQNRLYNDNSEIDPRYEPMNVFEDLAYEELCKKWEIKKTNRGACWIEKTNGGLDNDTTSI